MVPTQSYLRADQIEPAEGKKSLNYIAPIVADAEAGLGGPLHAFELMKAMIEAGASGVHFEDQMASEKKCGHLGVKVLVPTLLIARTDAKSTNLLMSDIDPRDRKFIRDNQRTAEGFFRIQGGLKSAISRARSYAPYADYYGVKLRLLTSKRPKNLLRPSIINFPKSSWPIIALPLLIGRNT